MKLWDHINLAEAVSERDVDLILLEESTVDASFRRWFLKDTLGLDYDGEGFTGAYRSITDAGLGESDLVVRFQTATGEMSAVLLENKIDADFQPDQAERYHQRGDAGVAEGDWASFCTCIVAPKFFLASRSDDATEFDNTVTYEQLEQWFQTATDLGLRGSYKAKLIRCAIDQSRRGYTLKPDQASTAFWLGYWELACLHAPELEMPQPGAKPADSDWPTSKPNALPPSLRLIHKLAKGCVDLELTGRAHEEEALRLRLEPLLAAGCTLVVTGKSLAVRRIVSPLDRRRTIEDQKSQVVEGLGTLRELLATAIRIAGKQAFP